MGYLFGSVASFEHVPIDNTPYSGEMIDAAILIVEIVGVFPHVDAENGLQTVADGIAGVGFLGDDELTFAVVGKPYPTAAEKTGTFLLEFLLESFE